MQMLFVKYSANYLISTINSNIPTHKAKHITKILFWFCLLTRKLKGVHLKKLARVLWDFDYECYELDTL